MKTKLFFNDSNGEGWHYIAVEALSVLLRVVISKHDGIFVKIVFIQLEQKTNLKVRENKDFCNIVMSSEKTKTLEFNQYHKYDRTPFIYTDLESLIKK